MTFKSSILLLGTLALFACSDGKNTDTGGDTTIPNNDVDADVDADNDADTDVDTDADADTDTDTGAGTDGKNGCGGCDGAGGAGGAALAGLWVAGIGRRRRVSRVV